MTTRLQGGRWLLLLIGAAFLAGVLCSAWLRPLTIDEAISFHYVQGRSWYQLLNPLANTIANHHLFVSAWMKSLGALGQSVFWLRLLSLACAVCYMLGVLQLFASHRRLPALVGVAALLLNVFVIEHFSLARGYSLMLAAGIWLLYFWSKPQPLATARRAAVVATLGAVATLANFSFVIFMAGLLLARPSVLWEAAKRWRVALPFAAIYGMALLYAALSLHTLRTYAHLGYGGADNVFSDTFMSLARASAMVSPTAQPLWLVALCASLLLGHLALTLLVFKGPAGWIGRVFWLSVLLEVLLFELTGTRYLLDRTALF